MDGCIIPDILELPAVERAKKPNYTVLKRVPENRSNEECIMTSFTFPIEDNQGMDIDQYELVEYSNDIGLDDDECFENYRKKLQKKIKTEKTESSKDDNESNDVNQMFQQVLNELQRYWLHLAT